MTDSIQTGDFKDSKGIAVGDGAQSHYEEHHHYPAAPEKPTFPIHQIAHPQNPNFTGREAILQQVAETLNAGQTTVVTQTIAGLGGVGKTQVALAYSYANLGSYDLIYWFSADSEPGLGEDLMALARRLKLVPPEATDQQAAVQAVRLWLGQTSHKWLLVYDNADQIEPGQLTRYLPRSGNGHVLITSRNPNYGGVGQVLELGLFELDEAVDFLFRRKEAKGEKVERGSEEWHQAADLAEALGRLPLALEHAAAYMASKSSSYAKYHLLFTQRQNELWQRAEKPERYHATITTTWELAFDEIKKTPGALELLNLCCFLDPESIPLALIKQIAFVETLHATSLRATMVDDLALDDALGALRRYSLMQKADSDLTLHRLVQAVARMQMGEELAQKWGAAAIELVTSDLPDWHHLHAWDAGPQMLPHMIVAADLGAAVGLETERLAFLDNWSGYYLQFRGEYRSAKPFYERALAIKEKALGPDHPDTALSLNNLGALLDSMGDLAGARPFYERALAINEKALGPDHPDTASSLNNLGGLLHALGQSEQAMSYIERAYQIRLNVLGDAHPDTALSLWWLGSMAEGQGQIEAARRAYTQAHAIYQRALGTDHPTTQQVLAFLNRLNQ